MFLCFRNLKICNEQQLVKINLIKCLSLTIPALKRNLSNYIMRQSALESMESLLISRPRVARAGTNKLKCQKNLPTGSHLTQISARVPNLDDFLNLNNFGQNGQN